MLDTDSAVDLGNDRQAGDRRTAAERPQRLEPRDHDARACSQASNSDIGLSFRGAGQREIQNSLSLDGINSSSNLLASTSMRPIADAVEEVQVQTGSTSAEYGSYLGVAHQRGDEERHQRAARVRCSSSQGRFARQPRIVREPGESEEPAAAQSVRLRRSTGRWSSRGSTTATTRRSSWAPTKACARSAVSRRSLRFRRALMRQGNFSGDHAPPIRNPLTGQPFPGNIIPQSQISPVALKLLQYYPAPNLAGTTSNLQSNSVEQATTSISSWPRRSEHRQQDPAVCPLQLARQPQHAIIGADAGDRQSRSRG